jgi:hypothetical protein
VLQAKLSGNCFYVLDLKLCTRYGQAKARGFAEFDNSESSTQNTSQESRKEILSDVIGKALVEKAIAQNIHHLPTL